MAENLSTRRGAVNREARAAHENLQACARSYVRRGRCRWPLEVLKDSLPEYGLPYADPEGNIVIPNKLRMPPNFGTPVPDQSRFLFSP